MGKRNLKPPDASGPPHSHRGSCAQGQSSEGCWCTAKLAGCTELVKEGVSAESAAERAYSGSAVEAAARWAGLWGLRAGQGTSIVPWGELQPEMPHKGVGCRYGLRNTPSRAWENVAVEMRRAKCGSEGNKPGVRGSRKPFCSFPHVGVLATNNLNLRLDLGSPMPGLEACSPGPQGRHWCQTSAWTFSPVPLEAPGQHPGSCSLSHQCQGPRKDERSPSRLPLSTQ